MSHGYLPSTDAGLNSWAQNFLALVSPEPAVWGLSAAQVASLTTVINEYSTTLATATEPSTRTKVAVANKNTARAAMLLQIRAAVHLIQAQTTVTPGQKTALGITVADRVPSPVPPPATRPVINAGILKSRSLEVHLADELTPSRKARPAGAAGAEVYSWVGTGAPPMDLELWRYEGLATRWRFVLDFEDTDSGKSVTIAARWINAKGQTGPLSDSLIVTVPFPSAQAA